MWCDLTSFALAFAVIVWVVLKNELRERGYTR